jgi:hypothetical protein
MAFSPNDPAAAHSLWLQLRRSKRKHLSGWRSDWMPLWVVLLLFGLLIVSYAIMPSNEADQYAEQAAKESRVQDRQMQGALAP